MLRHRITIKPFTTTKDEGGSPVINYGASFDVWADFVSNTGNVVSSQFGKETFAYNGYFKVRGKVADLVNKNCHIEYNGEIYKFAGKRYEEEGLRNYARIYVENGK